MYYNILHTVHTLQCYVTLAYISRDEILPPDPTRPDYPTRPDPTGRVGSGKIFLATRFHPTGRVESGELYEDKCFCKNLEKPKIDDLILKI